MSKSSFFAYLVNGSQYADETTPLGKTVQDQDTAIGDAMVQASQLFYEAAKDIANCISENCQEAIDFSKIRKAVIALAYMEGVDYGLAMDDKIGQWYLLEMKKSMATIFESRNNAFQTQIYVPIAPWIVMGYNPYRCSGHTSFIHALSMRQPEKKQIDSAKKKIMEDKWLKQHLQKMAEKEYPELFEVFPDLHRPIVKEREEGNVQEEETSPNNHNTIEEDSLADGKPISDDSPSVLSLRNLYRQNKIDKNQYIGSLATLLATGLINKAQFTRLKLGA